MDLKDAQPVFSATLSAGSRNLCFHQNINYFLNPFASGIKKVLLYPIMGLFSVKIQKKNFQPLTISLSMIRCPDNQINASFIDISRIKWLVFLLWSSFFRTTTCSTVASSEAPADYQPAPGRTDGVPERHQRQWIINPSLQICAWNFNRTGRG